LNSSSRLVVHALPWFAPESWGGTEQYVAALIRSLREIGWDSMVMAPARNGVVERYRHEGISVVRWRWDEAGADAGPGSFSECLDEFSPAVFHLHGWTPLCGAAELAAAHTMGIATVATVHTPSLVCATGTMLYQAAQPCAVVNSTQRCARCWLQSRGMPYAIAAASARVPEQLSKWLHDHVPGRARHVPGARGLMWKRSEEVLAGMRQATRLVAVCEWLHQALLDLGADPARTLLCRQGVEAQWCESEAAAPSARHDGRRLELAYVGRWDRVKGLHLLVQSLRRLPADMPIQLTMGVAAPADAASTQYRSEILAMTTDDARFELRENLARAEVKALLSECHVLAIPSQWMETGPLVALEARALGTFVLASDLGGLRELLHSDEGAQLIDFDDIDAWSAALSKLVDRRMELADGKPGTEVRNSRDVAAEMAATYTAALRSEAAQQLA
jgi:glycosyltransferase involved in cell wall biosynthesis